MNYVKHMNEVFQQFSMDDRLNPNHISLYLAIFQEWNGYRFARKTFVFRGELMKKSKIRSKTTYHRCMTELNKWGYIVYHPSRNSFKGSVIEMTNPKIMNEAMDGSEENGVNQVSAGKILAEDDPSEGNGSEEDDKLKYHSYKKGQKKVHQISKAGQILVSDRFREDQKMVHRSSREGQNLIPECSEEDQKMVHRCPEEDQNLVPNINIYKQINNIYIDIPKSEKEVIDFFRSKKWKVVEAQKFFHHYQSIGWKKGGTIPLKDWRAAAKNWVIRGRELKAMEIPAVKLRNQDNLKISKTKHYDEPL